MLYLSIDWESRMGMMMLCLGEPAWNGGGSRFSERRTLLGVVQFESVVGWAHVCQKLVAEAKLSELLHELLTSPRLRQLYVDIGLHCRSMWYGYAVLRDSNNEDGSYLDTVSMLDQYSFKP